MTTAAEPQRVLIMAGGTGGHVVPALSLARALQAEGVEVHWLGTPRGIENTLVPKAEIPLHHVSVSGLRGNGVAGWLKAPLRLGRAVLEARRLIRKLDVRLVVGLGGFASGPGGLAARLVGVPLIIHEQNAVAGMTNRCLARLAQRVYAAFPGAFPSAVTPEVIGNPVRPEIAAVGEHPRERHDLDNRPLHVLVMGGSLGAVALNERLPEAIARFAPEIRPVIRHQAGRNKEEATRERYDAFGVEAEVSAFIEDMAACYDWADLVICRSGALTVTELAAAGKPALLVPFPHAVDDHQTTNARYLVDGGGARLIQQRDMSVEALYALLVELLCPSVLASMAHRARDKAQLEAVTIMTRGCMEIGFEH
ncbi:undecaprenyldiphospho-muramoylpentapeptide beta-N-acetylglucosaminyltransferase [Kushneria phosphatilytica]|uniref:UDP-N-acetylglucosamine--N-acetylmuramyl-(pentapeptide) pyrophosphoryl-undecaprenol N-acetylglucosamine transferase n=1 Tax=Kushneria phosphatilytica TaxID=657387 RepID=A0A1S1NSI8_9GAMM|nr:undecaprenyldiphospho-muramoylpentapeptide beta-N-acetylglucosaminyltransferase [Kushneria phosphatilytica]OHV12224.1 undecaprenyldiphospho-muramoylpentapeptide beta-N-acetylglucosaminyltransferase [Kushneria phosphatilytica]QEL11423.1 undecaprenyldiphospho-muramoylpentapeptide beta-N-acetylglucosaminyltransferase [Kushneria phosphatilytica]